MMLAFALPALAAFTPYQKLKAARVQDVRSSALVSPLDGLAGGRSLVVPDRSSGVSDVSGCAP